MVQHGLLDATMDEDRIRAMFSVRPDANLAVRTDGLFIVDVDGPDNPWLDLEPEKLRGLDAVPQAITPRGGRHYWFRQIEGRKWRNTAGRLAEHVDTRADGGYVLVAPSIVDGKPYYWRDGHELTVGPSLLPKPPAWLVKRLENVASARAISYSTVEERILEGRRNAALTRIAGAMRRVGMTAAEMLPSLTMINERRCSPPISAVEILQIAESVARYAPDEVAAALARGELVADTSPGFVPRSIREIIDVYPTLRKPVIHGLLRSGETMNIISAPKAGKSWLATDLSLAVVTGRPWLGRFETVPGDVLIIDNELHGETSAHRVPKVAEARGIARVDYVERLFIANLRGRLRDIEQMRSFFHSLEPARFQLIVIDALYRFLPQGVEENDNAGMTRVYNALDAYADYLGCAFVTIHHASKGSQAGKAITDIGAGAGSQARATDTHLVLRQHQEPDVVVLDAAVRSWEPVEPVCLRWVFPLWDVAEELDPSLISSNRPGRRANQVRNVGKSEGPHRPWSLERFVEEFISEEPRTRIRIIVAAEQAGLSESKAVKFLGKAEAGELIHRWEFGRNRPCHYATVPQPQLENAHGDER